MKFLNFLIDGLSLGCIYALIAVGYSMVYGIIKLINFAHGEIYMAGAFVGYYLLLWWSGTASNGPDLPFLAALVAIFLAGGGAGLLAVLIEWLVYRPLRHAGRVVALLAALGVSLFLQNAGQQTVGAKPRTYPHTFTFQRYPRTPIELNTLKAGETAAGDIALVYTRPAEGGVRTLVENIATRGNPVSERALASALALESEAKAKGLRADTYIYPAITVTNAQLLIVVTLALTSLALYVLVQHTRFGRAMRAVSHDFQAASLMGINVNTVIRGTFFIGAFVAGSGGTLAGGMYYGQCDPLMGLLPGLKAFVAAVIGGIGSIPGAVLGGLLLGSSEKLIQAYFSSLYSDAFTFTLLIVMLVVRPAGLLGRTGGEKL